MSDFDRALRIAEIVAGKLARKYNDDVDACLSDAYFAVVRHFDQYQPDKAALSTYITRAVRNKILDRLRVVYARKSRGQGFGPLTDAGVTATDLDSDYQPLVERALELAASGKKHWTIKTTIRTELRQKGWSGSRIDDAFDAITESISASKVWAVQAQEDE
jgi:DNA-directed RNA polymerase specialized sigma24 family protein